jgi:hypothetical protein
LHDIDSKLLRFEEFERAIEEEYAAVRSPFLALLCLLPLSRLQLEAEKQELLKQRILFQVKKRSLATSVMTDVEKTEAS